MDNQERVMVRDDNTYHRYGDKWYLIDGPAYKFLSLCIEKKYAKTYTLFTWDGSICDRWETRSAVIGGKRAHVFMYKDGELLEEGRYNGCDWGAMMAAVV